ncbi:T9SS type A sorting domain-containing protein [Flavivirga rizhaonensis]|nr:T9SS type A sorting domain-containing protein [Flavivirga rizhaonensis]
MKTRLLSKKISQISKALILVLAFYATNIQAQNSCESFGQSLSLVKSINDCGNGGRVNTTIEGGQTPFNFSIKNIFTNQQASTVTSNRSLNIGVFPGTFEINIIDANGCKITSKFTVFADNFIVKDLGCNDNGTRKIRFSNKSTSLIPIEVEILGFTFNLNSGTSLSANLPEDIYTATISRPTCAPYEVSFGVTACKNETNKTKVKAAKTKKRATQSISIEEVATKVKGLIYPNPTSDKITIDLGTTIKKDSKASIIVYDNSGTVVLKENFKGKSTLNLRNFGTGLYFLNVIDENGNVLYNNKVIKK